VTSYSGPLEGWADALARARKVPGVEAAGPSSTAGDGRHRSQRFRRGHPRHRSKAGDVVVDVGHHMVKGSVEALADPQEITLPASEAAAP